MDHLLEFTKVLAWPITVLVILFFFRSEVRILLARLTQAKLPGGVTIDFAKELEEAKSLSRQVATETKHKDSPVAAATTTIPITDANAKMLSVGLRPSPSGLELAYYVELAERDPSLALAALRMELEIMGQNLARGFNVPIEHSSAGVLYRQLSDAGAITNGQLELVQSILRLCNAAIHGTQVTKEEASDIIDTAAVLRDQYLSWLTWGFDNGGTVPTKQGE